MRSWPYLRFELVRVLRNRRFLVFSLGFPLVLYVLIAAPNRGEDDLGGTGLSAPLYYMVGLAAFGSMNAVMGSGARISWERSLGWTRQLRLTPLPTRTYFRSKLVVAYLTALLALAVLFTAGVALGVSLPASDWAEMTALMLVGLLPFAAIGIVIGHLVAPDSIGPALGGTTALLGLLGGVWFPVGDGALGTIAKALPSYWLVQASHVALGGAAWGALGWAVVAAWTAGATAVALWSYRRDQARV